MPSRLLNLNKRDILPLDKSVKWLKDNLHYEVIMGSQSYGVNQDDSDEDIYGWAIPPKNYIFPQNYIRGFGEAPPNFDVMQRHHVMDGEKEYDFNIYSVIKYFNLVLENNPNMVDSLWVPNHCVTHMTEIGAILRNTRKEWLHKGAYHRFKGYSYSQIHKIRTKQVHENMSTKRRANIEKHGFDTKFASHSVRLLDECEQILTLGEVDITRDKERLKSIRRGDFTLEQIFEIYDRMEKTLADAYAESKLPYTYDQDKAYTTLMSILEAHYGSLTEMNKIEVDDSKVLDELETILRKFGRL